MSDEINTNNGENLEEESAAARRLRILGDRALQREFDTPYKREQEKKKKLEALTGKEERKTQEEGIINENYSDSAESQVVNVLSTGESDDGPAAKGNWFANFWYHHKWKVIIALFVCVIVTVCSIQFFSKVTPDVYLMYVGPTYVNATANGEIGEELSKYCPDYNKDNKNKAQFSQILYLNSDQVAAKKAEAEKFGEAFSFNAETNAKNYEQFTYEVMGGETVIYLLDPALYETIKGDNILMKLEEVLGEKPENAYDDYAICLKDTDAYKNNTALQTLPGDTMVCIRRVMGMSFFTGKDKAEKALNNHSDYLEKIIFGVNN